MTDRNVHAVTGAFGYSGKYIAAKLLAQGKADFMLVSAVNYLLAVFPASINGFFLCEV